MTGRIIKTPVTYRPNRLARLVFGYGLAPLILLYIALSFVALFLNLPELPLGQIIFGGLVVFFLAQAAWNLMQTAFFNKLVLWDSGLEVYVQGTHSFIRWEDLERTGWRTRNKIRGWGVYASRIERQEAGFFARHRIFSEETNFVPLDRVVSLPRSGIFNRRVDMARFLQTPLGQDLLHFAPHLFDKGKAGHEEAGSFYDATGYEQEEVEGWLSENPADTSRLTADDSEVSADDVPEVDQTQHHKQA